MGRFFVLAPLVISVVFCGSIPCAGSGLKRHPLFSLSARDVFTPWVLELRPQYDHVLKSSPRPVWKKSNTSRKVTLRKSVKKSVATTERGPPFRTLTKSPKVRRIPFSQIYLLPKEIEYHGPGDPGMIVVDSPKRLLYFITEKGKAKRYVVAVGRPGFEWSGEHRITRKVRWPTWTPPAAMLKRKPYLPSRVEGGVNNPLGRRALYLGNTLYRIHGTNEAWAIGRAVSAGCIRMRNDDVADLYDRVKIGTRVLVL